MDVSRGGLAVLLDVSKILSEDKHVELGLKKGPRPKQINRRPSSPDAVITAGSENSVPCARGEIGTGYA